MSDRKLKAWESAGLIDAATADRIRAWEDEHRRPLGLWAVFGIAALAIGLGILSVVAANWDDIPGVVRLALHFALMAGLALWLWLKGERMAEAMPWANEALLFVLGALGLTFMGHVGQVYQTSSPLWQPMALWLVLFAPLLLLQGLSWLTAAMIVVAMIFTGWSYGIETLDHYATELGDYPAVTRASLAVTVPVLLVGAGAWMRGRSRRETFWRRLDELAVTYGAALASLVAIVSAFDRWPADDDAGLILTGLAIGAAVGVIAAALVWFGRPVRSGRTEAAVLMGASAVAILAFFLSDSATLAGMLFMALWAGIAAAALYAGWRGVFQAAVAIIAFRLIILSFELAGDLLLSGVGLIISGLLILAIAFVATRVARRFAPDKVAREREASA